MMSPNFRIEELELKKRDISLKVTELNNWLLKNFDHPDRQKCFNDKAFYQCEINHIDKKIAHLRQGLPELGVATEFENNNLNQHTINQIKS